MEEIYFKFRNRIEPHKGCLLISEPYLPDPNFKRTVILLCEHNDDGTFGFVLNRPSKVKLDEIAEIDQSFRSRVYIGGPVQQDMLHFLHTASNYLDSGTEVFEGLYWGGDFDYLISLIDTHQVVSKDFRFFIGYSGWGPGQLELEIEENSWIVSKGLPGNKILRTPANKLWELILKHMGGRFEMYSKYPPDPRLN